MNFEWPSWIHPLPFPFPELHNFKKSCHFACIISVEFLLAFIYRGVIRLAIWTRIPLFWDTLGTPCIWRPGLKLRKKHLQYSYLLLHHNQCSNRKSKILSMRRDKRQLWLFMLLSRVNSVSSVSVVRTGLDKMSPEFAERWYIGRDQCWTHELWHLGTSCVSTQHFKHV